MKIFGLFLLTFFSLMHFVGAEVIQLQPAPKAKAEKPTEEQPQLQPYIDFILEWTSYKYQGEALPQIKIEKHEMVQIFAYGDYVYAQAEYNGKSLDPVLALYDAQRKIIYVSDQISEDAAAKEVALVHELVHYLQDINGYMASLNGHVECTEGEAYDVQMLWQILKHVNEDEIPFVRERSLLSAMECMGDMSKAFSER